MYENQSTRVRSRPDGARHVSAQTGAKTARIRCIRLREIALESSTLELPFVHLPIRLQTACHSSSIWKRGKYFTRLQYLFQLAQVWVKFGAGEILQRAEFRRHDRRAPQGAPGTRLGSVWSTTSNGKQISTRRRDVRCSPTCQPGRSCCCGLTQPKDLSQPTDFLTVPLNVYQCQMGPRPRC